MYQRKIFILDQLIKTGLIIGGSITLIIGIAHFFMPSIAFSEVVTENLPKELQDHFVYLAIYMLGTFLCALGLISFYLVRISKQQSIIFPTLILFFVWVSRIVFEIFYPVKIVLFGVDNPTTSILIVASIVLISYGLVFFSIKLKRSNA
ncbi:MAG: hypothetical protein CMO01_04130 [Thalassobius sp.]|nr:hypothetical protein [Thalassovita sp.]